MLLTYVHGIILRPSSGQHLISSDRQHLSYYDVCLEVSENASMAFFCAVYKYSYLLTYLLM